MNLLLATSLIGCAAALQLNMPQLNVPAATRGSMARAAVPHMAVEARDKFYVEFEIPKKGISEYGTCQANLAPLLESSDCVTIELQLPLGLNAEPEDGRVVVKKDGPGGEKAGDVLRFFSAWKDTFGSAQPEMVDVDKMMMRTMANGEKVARSQSEGFDKVVQKLVSNDGRNADSMFMVFERPTAAGDV